MREKAEKERELDTFKDELRDQCELEVNQRCQDRANELETFFEEQLLKRDQENEVLKEKLLEASMQRLNLLQNREVEPSSKQLEKEL